MFGLPRFAPKTPLYCLILTLLAGPVLAQDAAAPAAIDPALKTVVENYWHFGKVARYELAAAEGQKILSMGKDAEEVLRAFEAVSADRGDNLDQYLLRWQGIEQMKDVNASVVKVIADGYVARRSDTKFIQQQIDRLTSGTIGDRPYSLAITRLRESGELAVPTMIAVLRDPTKRAAHPNIRQGLRDLGKYALNPLVAATEMKDWDTLVVIATVLGEGGYDAAAPYLAKLLESPDAPASVKAAAGQSLSRLGIAGGSIRASDLFFTLGEKIYDQTSSLGPDTRFPTANVWQWKDEGLVRTRVPQEIFHEVMAMRSCEYTLKMGGGRSDDALSLWLAANYRRESELPDGQTDATRPEGNPTGHFWGVEAGAKYLNSALARALRDRNSAVAFKAIRSLQEIVGQSNLSAGGAGRPLINAMQFPDRTVRFESAFALAQALPQTNFDGSQRVIPLLAEAISQTGRAGVIIVMPNADQTSAMVEQLKAGDAYNVAGASEAAGIISASLTLPAIDVIVVHEDLGPGNVDQLFNFASDNVRLAGAARLVITKTNASMYETRKVSESLLSTTTAADAAGLKAAIEEARKKVGSGALDTESATKYATRAGELMLKVGISRGQVYDLAPAKQALLAALSDTRPAIVALAGQVLGLLNDKDSQVGLLAAAMDEKHADEIKIGLYKSLATNAKFFGNHLEPAQLQDLEKTVGGSGNLEVRSAAAEARGALNLPADQAKSLIVGQSKL